MTEEEVAAFVDGIKLRADRRDELVALLPESAAVYAGRSSNAAIRIRGYALAAFEGIGTPPTAIPYILDELQNGRDAYLVAAAAKAVRGVSDYRGPELARLLVTAINNIRYCDDAVTFATYKPQWPVAHRTTALEEIVATLAWLGPVAYEVLPELQVLQTDPTLSAVVRDALADVNATLRASAPGMVTDDDHCCTEPMPLVHVPTTNVPPRALVLEDQEGRAVLYNEFFSGAPSVVVFFYTRCDNPNKCSLTISKLGQLQHLILGAGLDGRLKTAAITYDPAFDLPARLRAYGETRNVTFDEHNRFFRSRDGFDDVRNYFELGVNFGDVLVNRHRIELYMLDSTGSIVEGITRLQWDPEDVFACARRLVA